MTKLALSGLRKTYGGFVAVDDIDLFLEKGEFVSLLGPSGCGKTTTLRMIAGFVEPSAGKIEMDGRILSMGSQIVPPERRGMAMIFQSYAIWPNMTVRQNVAFGLKMRKIAADEARRRVDRILETVRLAHLADRYPNELSGGQQQRVALARSIVVEPEILLLDEPLSNLDANLREEMRIEIRRLHDAFGMTTVYVTHDQSEAMAISDRIAVMNGGRIEQVGRPYDVYTRPETRFVAGFIGRTNLIDGRRNGSQVDFEGFSLPAGAFDPASATSTFEASLRPQDISIHAEQPGDLALVCVRGNVVDAHFLGETWDYVVSPDGSDLRLRVSAPAKAVFAAGRPVWLGINPAHILPIKTPGEHPS